MSDFSFTLATLIVLVSSFIPGFLVTYPLLRRTKLKLAEIALFGIITGIFVPPAMLFVESLLGIGFSFGLVLANLAALTLLGGALSMRGLKLGKGAFELSMDLDELSKRIDFMGHGRRNAVWLLLFLVLLFAFWVRIAGFQSNPYIHSPDPYSYLVTTRFILNEGDVPLNDNLAWAGNSGSHREKPLMQYMLASWYVLYTWGGGFDHLVLLNLADMYPALFGALGCFLLFVMLSRYVGEKFGLFAAAQGTLLPILVIVVGWGPEQVPWAIFSLLAFLASYLLLSRENRWEYAVLASIAMLGVSLGSKADIFVYSVFALYAVLHGTMLFLARKLDRAFIIHNLAIGMTAVISVFLYSTYKPGTGVTPAIIPLAAMIYIAGLFALKDWLGQKIQRRNMLEMVMALLILAMVVYISPAGSMLDSYAESSFRGSNLFSTIAEQQEISPLEYVQALGPFGYSLFGVKVIDLVMLLLLVVVAFDFMYSDSREAALIGVVVLPLYFVLSFKFNYQLRFVSYLGIMSAIAISACLGRVYGIGKKLAGSKGKGILDEEGLKTLSKVVAGVVALLVAYQGISLFMDLSPFALAGSEEDVQGLCVELKGSIVAQKLFCNKVPDEWVGALGWLRENSSAGEAVLAWWDYGHWINYIGERRAVIRNDLAKPAMVREVAYAFTQNSTEHLSDYMRRRGAGYVLFDTDMIDKWDAITYLSCLGRNETRGDFYVSEGERSECEKTLDFEMFGEPRGLTLQDYCDPNPQNPYVRVSTNRGETYCIPSRISKVSEIFDKNMANPTDVKFHVMNMVSSRAEAPITVLMLHLKDLQEHGDAYASVFYRGWGLGELEGFERVDTGQGEEAGIALYKLG